MNGFYTAFVTLEAVVKVVVGSYMDGQSGKVV